MKHIFQALAVSGSLLTSQAFAETNVPGKVVSCYKGAVNDLFEQAISEGLVKKYVDPENIFEYLRLEQEDRNEAREKAVIKSVIHFAKFVKREIEKRQDSVSEGDLKFTFYKEYSTKIVVKGIIDDISFKVVLEPTGECKILDFVLEGVKGMLDTVPRD